MKRIASLVLIILMALSSLPAVSADELGRGKFEASGTFASGKGTVYIKLDPPAESLVVSGAEMEVVLPKGFSFGGKSTQAISGWEITEGNVRTTDGRYAKKIAKTDFIRVIKDLMKPRMAFLIIMIKLITAMIMSKIKLTAKLFPPICFLSVHIL